MIQKAAQISSQLSEFKEEVRKKKLSIQFSSCQICRVEIDFQHSQGWDDGSGIQHIIETGCCPSCKGTVTPRRYTVQ